MSKEKDHRRFGEERYRHYVKRHGHIPYVVTEIHIEKDDKEHEERQKEEDHEES